MYEGIFQNVYWSDVIERRPHQNLWQSRSQQFVVENLKRMGAGWSNGYFGRFLTNTASYVEKNPDLWIYSALTTLSTGLQKYKPSAENALARRQFLQLLDSPLQIKFGLQWHKAVGQFYQTAMQKALHEIAHTEVTSGVRVWKLYNMGFVVKSAATTVGFDIHPGWKFEAPLTQDQQNQLVSSLDAVFITHVHADHLHRQFVNTVNEHGKPLIMPPSRFRLRKRTSNLIHLFDETETPLELDGVRVYALPGVQHPLTRNSVYIVEMGGQRIVHVGDNQSKRIYQHWQKDVDVLLGNCWSGLEHAVEGFRPKLLITGHENELNHPSLTCQSYSKTYRILDRLNPTCESHVINWGESVVWP